MGGGGVSEQLFLGILYIKGIPAWLLLGLLLGTWLSFPVFSIKFHVILVSKEEGEAYGKRQGELLAWGVWTGQSPCVSAAHLQSACHSSVLNCLSTFIAPSEILTQKAVWKDSFYR